jgi:hypothetical protein
VKGLDSLFRADDRVERLYVWAIRLEPKWSRERDLARAALKERPADLAGLIRQRRLMASRISWERHALKDLVAAMGEAALPLLVEAVEQEIPGTAGEEREARLSERGFALWTLSETRTLGEASLFADWWRQGVGRQEPGQAALLLECLAERGGAPEPLLEGLGWPHAGLRRSAAWGLGRLPSTAVGREALLTALGDSVLAVRISAFESLAQDSLLDGRRVAAALFDEERPSLARRELVRLLARRDGLLARRLVPRLEADPVLAAETDWIRAGLPPEAAPSPRQRRP